MSVDFAAILARGGEQLGISLGDAAVAKLAIYFEELQKWSRKVNLVSTASSPEEMIETHFLDSLALLPHLSGESLHLLDIGSGAGFPGLACAAAREEMTVTLVEPRHKRTVFLGHVARTLGLSQVRVLCCRVEDEKHLASEGGYSHITCRALTEIAPFLAMVERFAVAEPTVICMKGPKWREELAAAESQLAASSYRLEGEVSYHLPFSRAQRALLLFTKRENHLRYHEDQ